ncbi:MAG: Fe-S cluster assembly protein IscX [Phycisphaerales bacterium]
MPQSRTFGWLEVETIAERLFEAHPGVDPLSLRFVALRQLVEALPDFREEPGHPVNEKILETIQMRWHEEFTDAPPRDE